MIQEIFIKKIDRYSKNAKGIPYMGKFGPYQVVKIQADNGKYYSRFSDKINDTWQTGMSVSIDVEQKEVGGKTYYNFRTLKPLDEKDIVIKGLQMEIAKLKERLSKYEQDEVAEDSVEEPTEEDLPF